MYAYHGDDQHQGYPVGAYSSYVDGGYKGTPFNYTGLPLLLSKVIPVVDCPDFGSCWQDASGVVVGGPGNYFMNVNDGNDYFAARVGDVTWAACPSVVHSLCLWSK
jgi:hypothetical protein